MIRRFFLRRRLKKTMKPNPLYRMRRLAQFDDARKARYWRNVRMAGI